MGIDYEKEIYDLVNSIKVGDIVTLKDDKTFKVTAVASYEKKLVAIGLNHEQMSVTEFRDKVWSVHKSLENEEFYMYGNLDFTKGNTQT